MDAARANPYGGARLSAARREIAHCADQMNGAFTVEELRESVRTHAPRSAAVATIYRAVAAMEGAGYLERVGSRDGSTLYTRCSAHEHHHHVICEGCGRTEPADCPVDERVVRAARARGFTLTRHSVTLYGLCPTCAPKAGQ